MKQTSAAKFAVLCAARVALAADLVIPEGEIEATQVFVLHSELTYASGAAKPATFSQDITYEEGRFFPAEVEIPGAGRWNFRKHVTAQGGGPNASQIDLDFLKQRGGPKLLADDDKIMFRPFVGRSRFDEIQPQTGICGKLQIDFEVHEETGKLVVDYFAGVRHFYSWDGVANQLVSVDRKTGKPIDSSAKLERAPLKPTWHRALRYYQTPDSHFVVLCSAEDRFLWVALGEDEIDLKVSSSDFGDAKETLLLESPDSQGKRVSVEYPKGKMALLRHSKEKVTVDLLPAPAQLDIQSDLPFAKIRKSLAPEEK